MTADDFTEAARVEAEWRNPPIDHHPDDRTYSRPMLREHKRGEFVAGAVWGREQALAQKPTDAEIEAACRAGAQLPGGHPDSWDWWSSRAQTEARRTMRAALSAARAARRDEESR